MIFFFPIDFVRKYDDFKETTQYTWTAIHTQRSYHNRVGCKVNLDKVYHWEITVFTCMSVCFC